VYVGRWAGSAGDLEEAVAGGGVGAGRETVGAAALRAACDGSGGSGVEDGDVAIRAGEVDACDGERGFGG
jgi:hypothetical protein